MKTMQRLLVGAAAVLVAVPALAGGIKEGTFDISPMIGGYSFTGDQHLETMPVFGLRAGYNFTKYLGAELGFDYGRTEGTRGNPLGNEDTDVYRYGMDVLFHLLPDNNFVPYLAAGYGGISLDYKDQTNLNKGVFDYGPGFKYFLTDRMALRGDFRHLVYKDNDNTLNNFLYALGLNYQFGGAAPAAKPVQAAPAPAPAPAPVEPKPLAAPVAPVDTDGDGVIDSEDKCPGTPKGAPVDKNGCPVDTDGDGVLDYLDKCPETPKGATVDKNGCPLDTDGDGVFDYQDKCPGTPKGAPVDKSGCPMDADGDGVFDYLDKCPDTPKGAPVDATGCPLDSDADGVFDYLDKCPGTLKGLKVDKDGCPEPQKASISLAIEFDTAKADIRSGYQNDLKAFGEFMKLYPEVTSVIEGHTDNVGDAKYNQKLSQRRADNVRSYLLKTYGIAPDRLEAKGYGESRPVADNKTAAGRQKNRRIIATIDTTK